MRLVNFVLSLGVSGTLVLALLPLPAWSKGPEVRHDAPSEQRVLCAQTRHQILGECEAIAVQREDVTVSVVVTFSNGFKRTLFFEGYAFVRADPTMSGVGTDTDWRIKDGRYLIRVDDQRYELPVEFVLSD